LGLGLAAHPDKATKGLATLEEFLSIDPLTKIVVMSVDGDRASALKAVQLGAYAYHVSRFFAGDGTWRVELTGLILESFG
jgi:two-component system NtrC family response regulator